MSGDGAQSCLIGVTGNSELYTKYLKANGAAMKVKEGNDLKDNVKGSQCWCPITNFDTANAAYEWNLGQFCSTNTRADDTFTKLLSNDLTSEFVKYINAIKLKDPKGNELSLTNTNEGSYYDYLKSIIEESLNNFLSDTTFPWTRSHKKEFPRGGFFQFGPGGHGGPIGSGGNSPMGPGAHGGPHMGSMGPHRGPMGRILEEATYNTVNDYINYLNSGNKWVIYDSNTNRASITNVGDFIKKFKLPIKDVCAFDDLNRNQRENQVFGTKPESGQYTKHFDKITYDLLNTNKSNIHQNLIGKQIILLII